MSSVPRFSVIVPVYQVQAHLHECLESVLSQSFMDLELIAVDDCSPDACGAIVDEFAARDPRVRAVHLAEHQGPARARDAGLDQAAGDYLVLLVGGDTLTPDALWSIETRLKETAEPDVLVYGFAHTDWTGRALHGDVTAPLRTCRRDFVEREREGLTFPAGCHEDAPWTYPVLPAATSIATLDRVCVHHRQRRQEGVPGTTGRRDLDVLERHDRVFSRPGRLPRGCRAKFLRRARTYYRRHRTPGLRLPLRPRPRPALVRLGLHHAFRALRMAMALRRRTAKVVLKSLRALRAVLLQAHHRIRLSLPPRADRTVFSAHTTPRCRRPAPDTPPAGRRRPAPPSPAGMCAAAVPPGRGPCSASASAQTAPGAPPSGWCGTWCSGGHRAAARPVLRPRPARTVMSLRGEGERETAGRRHGEPAHPMR